MSDSSNALHPLLQLAEQHGLAVGAERLSGTSSLPADPPSTQPAGSPADDPSAAVRRAAIEAAMLLVQAGYLSPADAAAVLAAEPHCDPAADVHLAVGNRASGDRSEPPPESIASLIDRLRYPPEIVVQDWLDQLTQIVANCESAAAQSPDVSPPSLTLHDFAVDADNRLIPLSFTPPCPVPLPAHAAAGRLSERGRQIVEAFAAAVRAPAADRLAGKRPSSPAPPEQRRRIDPSHAGLPPLRVDPRWAGGKPADAKRGDAKAIAHSATTEHATADSRGEGNVVDARVAEGKLLAATRRGAGAARRRVRQRRTVVVGGALAACGLVVGGGLLLRTDRSRSDGTAPGEPPPATAAAAPRLPRPGQGAAAVSTTSSDAPSDAADAPLSTFSSLGLLQPAADSGPGDAAAASPSAITAPLIDPLALPPLQFDAPLPGDDADADDAALADGLAISDALANEAASGGASLDEALSDESLSEEALSDDPSPADQVTRQVPGGGIALPPRDNTAHWLQLASHPATQLQLDFPSGAAPARLVSVRDGWQVICTASAAGPDTAVAEIRSTADGTQFRWMESAAALAVAGQIQRGRLRWSAAGGGSADLYLRGHVQIDPLPFPVDQADLRAAWPLGDPPDVAAAHLAIDFQLPTEVQYGWIEPLQDPSLRRATAIAQLNLSDDEFVALGVRIDVQTGTRLACRVRTAARLDPSMPWQPASLGGVTRWADRVAAARLAGEAALSQIDALYELADARERAVLRSRRQRLQAQDKGLALAAERLGKLIQLMQRLQHSGTILWQLTVRWPDGAVQPILSTVVDPDRQRAAEPAAQSPSPAD